MKNERINGESGYKTFVVDNTLLEKYNGNDESLRLPGFIYVIGNKAFADNASLKKVILSSNVTAVGENAFDGCKLLEEVNLPYGLKVIGKHAFSGCVMLTSIIFNGSKERWLSVKKGERWLERTPDFIISCRDGDITKQEEIELEFEPQADLELIHSKLIREKQYDEENNELVLEDISELRPWNLSEFRERRRREFMERLQQKMREDEEEDEDEDVETDNNFAKYELFLQKELAIDFEDEEDGDKQVSITNKLLDKLSKTQCVKNLTTVLSEIAEKKQDEITDDGIPSSSMWDDEEEFDCAVMDRLEKLVRSDLKMARRGAIKKAETCLEAVRDTRDGQMMQVYERIVYELKIMSDSLYNKIRKYMRNGH